MSKDTSLHPSPQLVLVEQQGVAVALSMKQVISLFKKSEQSGIPFDTLKEVYQRGYTQSLSEQVAYNRVNSFIAGGAAMEIDKDLVETQTFGPKTTGRKDLHGKDSRLHHKELKASGYVSKGNNANYKNSEGTEHSYYHPKSNTMHVFRAKGGKINHAYEWTPNISYAKAHGADVHEETINEKRGLWDNIHAKRERIKRGSGERMRKPGAKGAPTAAALKASQTEDYTGAEKVSKNSNDPSSRFVGTNSLTDVLKKETPGYTKTIKRVVKEYIEEDAKGYKSPSGGLTQKGRDHYNRTTGSNLKAPVTTPPSKLKAGSKSANRRKSFCARMGGVEGPMRKPNGEPTRKALALRKWNCEETEIRDVTGKLTSVKKRIISWIR